MVGYSVSLRNSKWKTRAGFSALVFVAPGKARARTWGPGHMPRNWCDQGIERSPVYRNMYPFVERMGYLVMTVC